MELALDVELTGEDGPFKNIERFGKLRTGANTPAYHRNNKFNK